MTKALLLSSSVLALAAGLVACNVHDNTINATANIPNAMLTLTTTADVDNVMPSQPLPVTANVQNVYLIEPSATPPPEHEMDAGHLEYHIDDETMPAVLVTAQTSVEVPIPAETTPGKHKVICRLHKHDGEPTDTKFELEINVKVSVTVTGGAGSAAGAGAGGAAGGGGAGTGGAAGADGGATTTTVDVDASVNGSVTS
jgi:hypothetical protein